MKKTAESHFPMSFLTTTVDSNEPWHCDICKKGLGDVYCDKRLICLRFDLAGLNKEN
jgi:hypothetical protein